MKIGPTRIQTPNYVSIRKTYLEEVVLPLLQPIINDTTPTEKHYTIANKHLCLRFYSQELAKNLAPALAHLETSRTVNVDLLVHLWDSESTQTELPSPLSDARYLDSQVTDVRKIITDAFQGVYLHGEESITLYDQAAHVAYFWVHDARILPSWVSAAPIRTLLHWFLPESHIHLIHGAVVGYGGRAALLTAKGGSGKSTTALACLLSGMTYLADDYVGIDSPHETRAWSLYNSVKVTPESLDRFPSLTKHAHPKEGDKSTLYLAPLFPKQILLSATLNAILIPMIKRTSKTVITPASKMQAMLALMPTTLFQLPLAGTDKVDFLKKVIAKLPCSFLELSEDSAEATTVIKAFLAQETDKIS